MSVGVDMTLTQRDRLSKHIIACSEQVDIEDFVVLDEAEDALVVVAAALGAVGDNDALGGVRFDHTLSRTERK